VPCTVTTQQLQQYTASKHGLFLAHSCKYLHTDGDDNINNNNNNNNSDIFNTCAKPILS